MFMLGISFIYAKGNSVQNYIRETFAQNWINKFVPWKGRYLLTRIKQNAVAM